MVYEPLWKTVLLDNAIWEFSLAKPLWVMNHYIMLYKSVSVHMILYGIIFLLLF